MRRNQLSLFGLLGSILLVGPAQAQESGIRWRQDIESAKAEAQATGRLVLVHVWTGGCAPCLALEQTVFNQPGVAGAVEARFVPVKLNADEFPAMAEGLGITRVPTDVILTSTGQVIGRMISPATPSAYVAEVTQIASQYSSRPGQPYQEAVAAAPQGAAMNPAYAGLPIAAPSLPPASSEHLAAGPSPYAAATAGAGNHYAMPGQTSVPLNVAANPSANSTPFGAPSGPAASGLPVVTNPNSQSATMPESPPSTTTNDYAPAPSAATPTTVEPWTQAPPSPAIGAFPAQPPAAPVTQMNQFTQPAPAANNITTAAANRAVPSVPPTSASTSTAAPAPDARQLPPGAPPLGFDGYCPVSMRTNWKWVAGDPKWGAIHRGRTYWFAGPSEQQQFLANPDYFGPALSGVDPVLAIDHRQNVSGLREHSLDYDGQFYLFSSEATLQQFTANPERYATGVRQAMGIQPGRQLR